ncbi:MAG: agmatine deiminase family protein [Burkholderiales bacterium]|nr:agmatine deiminase family protein [Burkholderiales bacterium]
MLAPTLLYGCGGAVASDTPVRHDSANIASMGNALAVNQEWLMPDESDSHRATWMAFSVSEAIWGRRLRSQVQDALARIANTIVEFEPLNMLVSQQDLDLAKQKCDPRVNYIVQETNDLWIRDTGAVFVFDKSGNKAGVNFNFNGWGNKQIHDFDSQVAAAMTGRVGVPLLPAAVVMEGGGIEVDGEGTAIVTESCVLNPNRNPDLSKTDCEKALQKVLGVRKVIWLPGIAGSDITDGHTDFYARFARPGVVLANADPDTSSIEYQVTQSHLQILQQSRDAEGRPLQVIPLSPPRTIRPEFDNKDFAAGYINFYICNGAVIMPEFGDTIADERAKKILAQQFPTRRVIQLNIDPIAAGGGGIHCATQQEPAR